MQVMKSTLEDEVAAFVTGFNVYENAELEAVFRDRCLTGGGIQFELFQKLFTAMSAASKHGLLFATDKVAVIDFFFPDSVRTRYVAGKAPVTIKKTRIGKFKVVCLQRSNLEITIHLKNEVPLSKPPTTPALFVRLQEVWNFIYKNTFEFTLKKVVSGKDKADACTKPPVYEIEIEVLKGAATTTNVSRCAQSFLMKIGDLCGRCDEKGNAMKLHLAPATGVTSDLRVAQKKLIAARKRKEQRKRKKAQSDKPQKKKKKQKHV
jgi:hypothetical protein